MENGELRDGIIFHLFIINGANQINGRVRAPALRQHLPSRITRRNYP